MHLDAALQTVLQLSACGVVGVQAETRQPNFPHAGVLVEATLELVHCGGSIETHHLWQENQNFTDLHTLQAC